MRALFIVLLFCASLAHSQTPDGYRRELTLDWINPNLVFKNDGGGQLVSNAIVPCEVLASKDTLAFLDLLPWVDTTQGWPCKVRYFINERRAIIEMLESDACGEPVIVQEQLAPKSKRKKRATKDVVAPTYKDVDKDKWKGRKCEIKGIN